jgi:L-fuculose-phosphate aldolase
MKNTKQDVADCMNRLYERGLTTTSGGNISVRHGADAILLTPSATDKGRMKAEEIAMIGLDGTNRTPDLKPSIETSMHLEIYRRCADVQAVVHAHPPRASAFAAARRAVNTRLIAESYAILGEPVVASYALMGTGDLASIVAGCLGGSTVCVLMENHGALCTGRSLLEAFDRLEVLENAAAIELDVARLGGGAELEDARLREIDVLMGRDG